MNEERMKVLQMLATGKISVQEADQLIEVLQGQDFSSRQMLQLSEEGIDADFIKGLRQAGLRNLTVEQVMALHEYETFPDRNKGYLDELRHAWGRDLTFEQFWHLAEAGVRGDFIKGLREAGLRDLTLEQIMALHEYETFPGRNKDYLDELRFAWGKDLTFEQFWSLAEAGVRGDDIKNLRQTGVKESNLEQILRCSH